MLWQVHRALLHKKEHDHRTLNSACSLQCYGRFIEHCYTRQNTIREHRILHIHCNVLGRFIDHCYTRENMITEKTEFCTFRAMLWQVYRALLHKREHDHRTLNSARSLQCYGRFIDPCYTRENMIAEHRFLHIHHNVWAN